MTFNLSMSTLLFLDRVLFHFLRSRIDWLTNWLFIMTFDGGKSTDEEGLHAGAEAVQIFNKKYVKANEM